MFVLAVSLAVFEVYVINLRILPFEGLCFAGADEQEAAWQQNSSKLASP